MQVFDFATYTIALRSYLSQAASLRAHSRAVQTEFDARFNELGLALFRLQYESVPPFRAFADRRGRNPGSVNHWSAIPAIPTAAFKEEPFTSLPETERTRVFHSSGTTDTQPSRHYHSAESLAVYEASLLPWFEDHVLTGFPRPSSSPGSTREPPPVGSRRVPSFLFLTPPPDQAPHSSLVHMFATIACAWGVGPAAFTGTATAEGQWQLPGEATRNRLETLAAAGQPLVLLGTAFAWVQLLDHLALHPLSRPLPPGSRLLETGGYKGRSRTIPRLELYRLLGTHLGVARDHIVSEYGMSELSSQAYDRQVPAVTAIGEQPSAALPASPRGQPEANGEATEGVFRFPPWARGTVVSPETGDPVADGEPGLLQVVDLANVRSVTALLTGDLAIRRGTGFELLGRAPASEPRGCSLLAAVETR